MNHRALFTVFFLLSGAFAQDVASQLDSYLKSRSSGPFMGVVLVARNGEAIFERGYGLADADLAVPNTPRLLFGIGSLTKSFTATAVMRLVERGQLRMADKLGTIAPDSPLAWRDVSVENLLSHTSGIPDLFPQMPAVPPSEMGKAIDVAFLKHHDDPLLFQPGSKYVYSNFNYFLLGYLLEKVSHRPWDQVMQAEIYDVVPLRSTLYDDVWQIIPNRVRGYTREKGELRNIPYHDHGAYAAGGLLSSAEDLLKFDVALAAGKLVSASTLENMMTPRQGGYGLGWQVIHAFGHLQRNHTGATNGFTSHLAHYDDGTTIVVLSNVETEPAKATACDLAAIVFGLKPSAREASEQPCRTKP